MNENMNTTENMNTGKSTKNAKGLLVGGVIAAAAALVALIARIAVNAEMNGIADSGAMIVQVGSEQMSKADYLEYASGLVSGCTAAAAVLLAVAVVLLVCCAKKKKN